MSRQLSEKQVLEMLGIPDFRHLSKDRIMSFTSALPQMEPQVAIAALQQVPHFADTSLEIMRIYKETVSQTLAQDQENVQSFNASCEWFSDCWRPCRRTTIFHSSRRTSSSTG